MPLSGSREHSGIVLAAYIVACEAVGAISGWLSAPQITGWNATLRKPAFNPPDWVFAPVWTSLYALMAIAAWLVWREPDATARTAGLEIFWVQLALNFLWSMIFFRGHALLAAGIEILLLLAAIVAATLLFGRISRMAAYLMTPYLLWVAFATVLTWAIWRINY
ncbi:MAG: TspO/MBR family protein [Acidobacteriaceae bacterium]